MKFILIAAHSSFATLWLGCILTEALFERALLPKGQISRLTLAHLHVRVDKIIEIPAIFGVLFTGLIMFKQDIQTSPSLYIMLVSGIIAIIANLYCVLLVFQRRNAAVSADWSRFEALDHRQHKVGAIVLVGVLIALVSGFVARSVA